MIIIQMRGGLGNQMFQYAFVKNYMLRGCDLFLDLSFYHRQKPGASFRHYELNSFFNVNVPELPNWGYKYFYSPQILWRSARKLNFFRIEHINETSLQFNKDFMNVSGNIKFSGYFQNERYFKSIESQIRKDFSFSSVLEMQGGEFLDDILKSESISIHIRRGDFVKSARHSNGCLSLDYYKKAVDLVKGHLINPKYFVFTDDPEWVKREFKNVVSNFILPQIEAKPILDMYLMSSCKHNVVANSSLSWWSAWLNNNPRKMIIAPKKWCVDPELDLQTSDIVPEDWIRI